MIKFFLFCFCFVSLNADYSSDAYSNQLGLSVQDYSFLMALNGSLVGFTIFISIIFLIIRR